MKKQPDLIPGCEQTISLLILSAVFAAVFRLTILFGFFTEDTYVAADITAVAAATTAIFNKRLSIISPLTIGQK